jgi:surface antigen
MARVECAPFARALSGVALYGDAADWWQQADGKYARGQTPSPGAVLVFSRSGKLPYGHVSVVSAVVDSRTIRVIQANWVHGQVSVRQPVVDVSPDNDWTQVRVFWPPSGHMGASVYQTDGFIRGEREPQEDALEARTPEAVRMAQAGD